MKLDYMMNAYDVAMELGVSKGHAYKVIRKLNAELEASGYIVVSGRVPRAYWEKKFYGYETKMKELKKGALEWENNCKMSANANMDMMLGSFVEIYFRDKAGELKERSVKNKRYMIKTHILPYFENKPMNSITPADIIQWQNIIRAKGFAPTYLRMIQNQITALFTHASNIYNLANNPCKKVKKMGKSDADRIDFGTREEYDRFIETFEVGSRYYVLFEILFWTGCREGELLALTKSDFDFYNNKLHISKTYYRTDCKDIITTPKTEQSVRTIDIPEFLKCEIKEYVDKLYELPDDERIFPIVAEAVQHALKRHAEKAGVKRIRVHSLRHSHVAYLINQGVQPLIIKERLGHRDIKITLNTYGHCATDEYLEMFYRVICERLRIDEDHYSDKMKQSEHFMAFAESGWDFTPRFWEANNPYAGMHYAPVDLNSILYEVECILSEFSLLLGRHDEAKQYAIFSEKRKALMDKYMRADDGIYYDYNFVTGEHSPILSAASTLPYMAGITADSEVLECIVNRLDGKCGLSVCEKTDWECHDQWAYPSVWPPICYFVYSALEKTESNKAKPFAQKYIKLVEDTYVKTEKLWEKYDAEKGGIPSGLEYDAVEMLGWTAGVYLYFVGKNMKKS